MEARVELRAGRADRCSLPTLDSLSRSFVNDPCEPSYFSACQIARISITVEKPDNEWLKNRVLGSVWRGST